MTTLVLSLPMLIHCRVVGVMDQHSKPLFKGDLEFWRRGRARFFTRFLDVGIELSVICFVGRVLWVVLDLVSPA